MARKRESEAIRYTIYLNPKTDNKQRIAASEITRLIADGYDVKDILVDLLCKYAGYTPEMLPDKSTQRLVGLATRFENLIDELSERFSADMIAELARRGYRRRDGNGDEIAIEDDNEVGQYGRNLARGMMRRQRGFVEME